MANDKVDTNSIETEKDDKIQILQPFQNNIKNYSEYLFKNDYSRVDIDFIEKSLSDFIDGYYEHNALSFSPEFINNYLTKIIPIKFPSLSKNQILKINGYVKKYINYLAIENILKENVSKEFLRNLYKKTEVKQELIQSKDLSLNSEILNKKKKNFDANNFRGARKSQEINKRIQKTRTLKNKDTIISKYEFQNVLSAEVKKQIDILTNRIGRNNNSKNKNDNRKNMENESMLEEIHEDLTPNIEDYYELDILYQTKDLQKEHRKLIKDINKLFPEESHTLFLNGYERYVKRDNISAIEYFDKAIAKGFSKPLLFICYGAIYSREGDLESAKEMYLKAIEIDNKNEIAHYNIAVIYRLLGNLLESERYCFLSGLLNPLYGKAYLGLIELILNPVFKRSKQHLGRLVCVLDPYNPQIDKIVNMMKIKESHFLNLINMSEIQINKIEEKLKHIWEDFNQSWKTIEQKYENRDIIYKNLIEFAQTL